MCTPHKRSITITVAASPNTGKSAVAQLIVRLLRQLGLDVRLVDEDYPTDPVEAAVTDSRLYDRIAAVAAKTVITVQTVSVCREPYNGGSAMMRQAAHIQSLKRDLEKELAAAPDFMPSRELVESTLRDIRTKIADARDDL